MFDDIVELVTKAKVAFPSAGLGLTERDVSQAEKPLGVRLLPSYRWWLLRYGGGQVGGDVVLGIDPDGDGPDLLTLKQRHRPALFLPRQRGEFFLRYHAHRD